MRLGIMQPYFFPYIGYFDVIQKTDQWIVFDVVKYQPKTWMNRNRILDVNKGQIYITVPVARGSSQLLSDVRVNDPARALQTIARQFQQYRSSAPFYAQVATLFHETCEEFRQGGDRLRDLNVIGLKNVCAYLGLRFDYRICSELDLDFSAVTHPGQWALEICDQLGADGYVNPSGGKSIFRAQEWRARGIQIAFTQLPSFTYDVGGKFRFAPGLSILDCMMWQPPDAIRGFLERQPLDHDP